MKKILTVISARGSSKGVPRKNVRPVGGKPLIGWAIEAALTSNVIDRLVVSTEDAEIADIARSFGAEVIDRPEELAGDKTTNEEITLHALEEMEKKGYSPDYISVIQCTSPFLSPEVIQRGVRKVTEEGFDSCITVFYPEGYEFKWSKNPDGSLTCEHDPEHRPMRQDLKLPYHENGAFYITRTELFKKTKNRFGGKHARVAAVEMSEADSLQIDSAHHLWLADIYMRHKLGMPFEH